VVVVHTGDSPGALTEVYEAYDRGVLAVTAVQCPSTTP
jgi:hypothetical protein